MQDFIIGIMLAVPWALLFIVAFWCFARIDKHDIQDR
ncbi:Uncharacterised protein [Plesiomonas shigelloides]|nr:Uncharacterised protein [Plesiomonas shigelloides]SPZ44033.1 Uncharacterised protein [Plesiomonas shigelloides]SUB62372.1 Uncharacterised protein [Plesiomonas shigelloides]